MGNIRIVTLMDNQNGERKDLAAEHGLSLYIETGYANILFDFGQGKHTYENAAALNIRPERVDYGVCSHGHYDHGGGYREFVKNGLSCPLATGKGFFSEKYSLGRTKAAFLGTGFDAAFLEENKIRHMVCDGLLPLAQGCWALGGIRRKRAFETIPKRFVLRQQGAWVQDYFQDEICLILEENGELTVIVGCSHPGILNILDTVRERFSQPIRAVIGGTHLVKAGPERIGNTIAGIKDMGIRLLGFNHCSGEDFCRAMEEDGELETVYMGVGDCLFL